MKILLTLLCFSVVLPGVSTAASAAFTAENAAVLKVVQEFFDALRAKDGARLRAICQPGAQVTSGRPSPGRRLGYSGPVSRSLVRLDPKGRPIPAPMFAASEKAHPLQNLHTALG